MGTALLMAVGMVLGLVAAASALDDQYSYDMTWRGATDTVNGAIISAFTPTDSTGTGYWHSFLRVSAANSAIVKGYNNDYGQKDMQFNEDPSWTESFYLKDVPQVMVGSVLYREFQLDINQNSKDTDALLSIDTLEVYTTNIAPTPEPGYQYPFGAGISQRWDLDAGADNVILLNFGLNPGSGKRDFKIQIPDALFGPPYDTWVILYTEHGGDAYTGYYDLDAGAVPSTTDPVWVENGVFGNNDGFEEWGVTKYPATKMGTKFHDQNANHVKDAGEPGLPNWTIYVDYDGDGVLDAGEPSAVTGADGKYTILGIEPGTYDVREVAKPGWICSYPNTAPDNGYYES